MRYSTSSMVISGSLIVVAIIHLLPLSGLLSADRLSSLYGIVVSDPNLEILMRHRAVLFGLLGTFLLYAAVRPTLQPLAFIGAFVSVLSFLWLAWLIGSSSIGSSTTPSAGYNEQIGRVFTADLVALGCLVVGVCTYVYRARKGRPR